MSTPQLSAVSVDTFHSVGVDTDIVTGVDPYIIQIIDFDLNTDNIIPPSGFREETSKMTSKTSIQLVKPLGERFYLCSTVAGKPLLWKDDNRKISPNITIYQNMSVTLYKPKTVEENNYTYLRSDHVQILPTNLPTKAMDNTAMEDLVATFYKDRKLTTLQQDDDLTWTEFGEVVPRWSSSPTSASSKSVGPTTTRPPVAAIAPNLLTLTSQ